MPGCWATGAVITKHRDLILPATGNVPGDAGLRTQAFGRTTEDAHRVCLDTSSQGVGSGPHRGCPQGPLGHLLAWGGLWASSLSPPRPPPPGSSSRPREHCPLRACVRVVGSPAESPPLESWDSTLTSVTLSALLPPQSRGLFATTFCKIRECLQAPELSLGGSQDGSQASP